MTRKLAGVLTALMVGASALTIGATVAPAPAEAHDRWERYRHHDRSYHRNHYRPRGYYSAGYYYAPPPPRYYRPAPAYYPPDYYYGGPSFNVVVPLR